MNDPDSVNDLRVALSKTKPLKFIKKLKCQVISLSYFNRNATSYIKGYVIVLFSAYTPERCSGTLFILLFEH